jgi:hypothetical protein
MPIRIDRGDRRPRHSSQARSYVYVLPCVGEDLLKVGFSRDPLQRMQTLHARWFEFFDIEAGFLIEADRVRDARRIEQLMARHALAHRAPAPLVVPRRAAGHTEWYRGARALLAEAAIALRDGQGYALHSPLRAWLRERLERQRDLLYDWTGHQLDGLEVATSLASGQAQAIARVLRDALDAYLALDLPLDGSVPRAVLDWHREQREPRLGFA